MKKTDRKPDRGASLQSLAPKQKAEESEPETCHLCKEAIEPNSPTCHVRSGANYAVAHSSCGDKQTKAKREALGRKDEKFMG